MYIMENVEIVLNLMTKEVLMNVGVSEVSVVCFCKLIGIGSFKVFKIVFVCELMIVDYNINDFLVMNIEDGLYDLFNKVIYVNKVVIEVSVIVIDKREFEKVVDFIVNVNKIIFYGVGGLVMLVMDGVYKFMWFGFIVMMLFDFYMMLLFVINLKEDDIFVVILIFG